MHWGKGNNQTFQGLSDTGCELTLVPGDPKRHSGPRVGAGAYGGQVIPGALALVCVHSHGSLCRPVGLAALRSRGFLWALVPLRPFYSLARTTSASSQEEASRP